MRYLILVAAVLASCGRGAPLPGFGGITWEAENDIVGEATMVRATSIAMDVLGEYTPWTKERNARTLAPVFVQVDDGLTLSDVGPAVIGVAYPKDDSIRVARDLWAMAHEFLHVIVYRETGDLSDSHAGM